MAHPTIWTRGSDLLYGAYLSGMALGATAAGVAPQDLPRPRRHVQPRPRRRPHRAAPARGRLQRARPARRDGAARRRRSGAPDGDAAGALWDLAVASNVPTSLADLGLGRDDLPEAAERAAAEITDNPRPFDADDLLALLERAFDGRPRRRRSRDGRVRRRRRAHAGRQARRCARRRASRRPRRNGAARGWSSVAGLDPDAIDEVYLGDANGAGEDNRNVARMATLLAGWPVDDPRGDGEPAVRLRAGGGRRRVARGRRRRCLRRRRRRRRVDVPGAVGAAEAVAGVPDGSRAAVELGARLADGQPADARSRGRWRSARAPSCSPTSTPSSREEQDAFAAGSHQRAAAAWSDGRFAGEIVAVDGVELDRDECIRAGLHRRDAGPAAPGVPRRRHGHGRQLVADERRRRGGGPRRRARRRSRSAAARSPASPPRATAGVEPQLVRHRAGRGGRHRAAPGRDRVGRPRRGRAQRGVRRAEPGLPARVARARPGHRQPARRGDRHRPPARARRAPAS